MKTTFFSFNVWVLLLTITNIFFLDTQRAAIAQQVAPVLEFPEVGLDDTSKYRGYTTRFFRDTDGNTLQIYIKQNSGRVVNIWADAANESIAFTARDSAGQPAFLTWGAAEADVTSEGKTRYLQYSLLSQTPALTLGHFLLNSMRVERDFQYFQRHTSPFDSGPFVVTELTQLIENMAGLPVNVRQRHLELLKAATLDDLRSRLAPQIERKSEWLALVEQPTIDGKNRLSLELGVDRSQATLEVSEGKISIRSLQGQPIRLTVKIGTDSPSLTQLRREDIFNRDFFKFYERAKSPRLARQVKSMELMCSQEKLFAGLPNYATYFGRDMMMSALMLEPVLKPAMLEHVIASVLKKLNPTGEVSHEEGLGGQAIRENAAKYNNLITDYIQQKTQGDNTAANKILKDVEKLLANLQAVTENYHMLDDDFQLPVLTARYLTSSNIPNARKREFLQSAISPDDQTSRLTLLLRNLLYVSNVSRSYVENPAPENLISFRKLNGHRWHAGSWRDSAVGYANGRYAMDINAIWVPKALESVEKIFEILRELGISMDDLIESAPGIRDTKLIEYAQKLDVLQQAIKTWRNAVR
ncbi:MAG: hypothetical protein ACE5NG_12985, partial [bacterium]